MREIKFRAWNKRTNQFGRTATLVEALEFAHNDPEAIEELDYLEFLQYTELKDKNGKEIYEGDILLDSDYGQSKRALAVVTYQGSGFVPHKPKPSTVWYEWCPIRDQEGSDWEIIGNIYENPELLKEKK